MDSGENNRLFELLLDLRSGFEETREMVRGIDKKLDLHIQKMEYETKEIRILDSQQNAQLAEHMQRSAAIQKDVAIRDAALRVDLTKLERRLSLAEEPRKWLAGTKSVALWIASVLGVVLAVEKLIRFMITKGH